jgi:NitT/TauT family transport system substrate-binding protein
MLPHHGGVRIACDRAADDPSVGNHSIYRLGRMACGLQVAGWNVGQVPQQVLQTSTANEHSERAPPMIRKALGLLLWAAVAATASSAGAADKVKLKMAEVVRSQFYVPMYVALSKGFVADEGLEVELVTANGGDRVGAMILSGQADFALAGPEVPVYIYNGESPDKPVIFCALTATDGLFLASKQKIDKFDWSMLNGKKIMGWRPGSTPELYLEYVLKQRGVAADTVKGIVTNVGMPARDGAFMAGAFDFAIFNEPNMTKLEKAGQAHVVTSIGKEVGRADYTLFFAKKSWIEKNPDLAQKWTNAIARGQAFMKTAGDKDIAEAIAPFFPGLTVEDNIAVVHRYRNIGEPIWAESTVVDPAGLAKAQEIMVVGGVLPADKKVGYDSIVTNIYAEKAQQKFASK